MLDFIFMRAAQEASKEEMEKMQKNMGRYTAGGGHHKGGRPLRTTSDEDYFERANQHLRDE
mgnify:CR=1 FL=1